MPTTLTGTATKATAVSGPSAGEVGSSSAMRGSLQTLIDNDVYMQTRVETTGVKKVQQVADSAALSALTGIDNNDVVLVTSTSALYKRNTAGAGSNSGTFYYDHSTEAGGWDLVRPANSLFKIQYATGGSTESTASSSYAEIAGTSLGLAACKTGDLVYIDAMVQVNPGIDSIFIRPRVVDGAAVTTDFTTQVAKQEVDGWHTIAVRGIHVLTADGSITASLRFRNNDGATSVSAIVQFLEVRAIRP